LRAAVLSRIGRFGESASIYRDLLSRHPRHVEVAISLANALKFAGDQEGAVAAFRRVLAIDPRNGEAWWSLADLKTYRFTGEEIASMEEAVAQSDLREDDRLRLQFALGKAHEDQGDAARAFASYAEGNRLRAKQLRHDPALVTQLVARIEETVTRDLLESRAGAGAQEHDPIFIIGMPRAGSTLVEQILASHPLIEGTGELPDIIVIARELEEAEGKLSQEPWHRYPNILQDIPADEMQRLGQIYIDRTRVQRRTGKPHFTDKMPNNWLHMGLIRLILPNAKVIDIRRNPLACGFSNFKQHYARGQEFSYDLDHFGQYYRDYVRLMRHFDAVSPGFVHRVIYEDLVEDARGEVERMLEFIGVPFDEACMEFHRTKRAVRTASAEQVRQPINSKGLAQWRRFEQWLDPLKRALGPLLESWRD
jgi:tetratricopeptide (TPR) repeat protein